MRISKSLSLKSTGMAIVLATGVLSVISCVEKRRPSYDGLLANTGRPALHAIHSERLRTVMGEMNRLTFTRMPQELGDAYGPQAKIDELMQVCGALSTTSEDIPAVLNEVHLSDEHRRVFVNLANKLRDQARELQAQAGRGDVEQLMDQWHAVIATCNACHSAFRILPVATQPEG